MRRWTPFQERGQTMVLFALSLLVLVGFLALAVDVGYAYAQRRGVQNAADAAALEGARLLASGKSLDEAALAALAAKNAGATLESAEQVSARTVRARTSKQVETFFARVLGRSNMDVSAEAEAGFGPASSVSGNLIPFAIPKMPELSPGKTYCLFAKGAGAACPNNLGAGNGPGNWGWVDFDGGSNPTGDLATWIEEGYDGPFAVSTSGDKKATTTNANGVEVGNWLFGDPGVNFDSKIAGALDARIARQETAIVIVWDTNNGAGGNNFKYHVAGFAAFKVTYYERGGNKYVKGVFQRYLGDAGIGSGPDYGVGAVGLVK